MVVKSKNILPVIYQRLYQQFGPQQWWPAQTEFEVIVGAILTQNTNWGNVERAIANLKKENVLSPREMLKLSELELAYLIRPAGYFNVKARRLKNFLNFFFQEYRGSVARLKQEKTEVLREKLLSINGIGPETADSILLYALDKPVFVVDAYTKRIFSRHKIVAPAADYHSVQETFTKELKADRKTYNEYHALIVRLGKEHCRTKPDCAGCPLRFLNEERAYAAFRFRDQ